MLRRLVTLFAFLSGLAAIGAPVQARASELPGMGLVASVIAVSASSIDSSPWVTLATRLGISACTCSTRLPIMLPDSPRMARLLPRNSRCADIFSAAGQSGAKASVASAARNITILVTSSGSPKRGIGSFSR